MVRTINRAHPTTLSPVIVGAIPCGRPACPFLFCGYLIVFTIYRRAPARDAPYIHFNKKNGGGEHILLIRRRSFRFALGKKTDYEDICLPACLPVQDHRQLHFIKKSD